MSYKLTINIDIQRDKIFDLVPQTFYDHLIDDPQVFLQTNEDGKLELKDSHPLDVPERIDYDRWVHTLYKEVKFDCDSLIVDINRNTQEYLELGNAHIGDCTIVTTDVQQSMIDAIKQHHPATEDILMTIDGGYMHFFDAKPLTKNEVEHINKVSNESFDNWYDNDVAFNIAQNLVTAQKLKDLHERLIKERNELRSGS